MGNTNIVRLVELEAKLRESEANSRSLYDKIRTLRHRSTIFVTDHAIVRYLERVKGVDMMKLIEEIVSPDVVSYYRQFGDGEFPMNATDHVQVRIKNGSVITIIK